MRRTRLLAAAAFLLTAGCYHATVNTALQPNGTVIDKPWAASFLGGLVPPAITETAQQCPGGVARVDTELSFLNMVANVITLGIYSPMHIKVQCGGGRSPEPPAADVIRAPAGEAGAALTQAVQRAVSTGATVWVQFQ
jgi:hypothetical protein